MTETAMNQTGATRAIDWADPALVQRVARRHRKDRMLRVAGLVALLTACLMLAILMASLLWSGHSAFTQTHVTLDFEVAAGKVNADKPGKGNYRGIVAEALKTRFPEVTSRRDQKALVGILSNGAQYILRDAVVANPDLIGTTVTLAVPVSDPYDQLAKGQIDVDTPEENRRLDDREIAWFHKLEAAGSVSRPLNLALLVNADSRFPELAGLSGALWGSFYALLVCFVISFPVGIAAGIYLEEFAPKNRWTDLIEVNINNLAAVPSVVFGLLALVAFIGWFGMPRSAPLVGGMTLSLMTLPTIIIATRIAVKAVPPSIRDAALGLGASKHQVVMGHVLPLAVPGILTGTIIGLARALGETAPLLLIGMNAFITQAPDGIMDSSTALPTQIFIWADSPERGFVARTSAAICVLLAFLVVMNGFAVYLRKRFERRW
ncbi:MAG TPA: phosphate ABC transporter permease PstA [Thermohalobaculum sp.]|nr:phosphate ABC transporter permease PstA [Thermohalobaculum sp.]